ncbi:hypothetical protein [Bradyrhizobium liaoningense]|uniref:hypothetical protein n=1 Tax=Bradyrhizobium liaoningense TaxID=43992 RepID=UPI001BA7ADB9|nr:hypothetical protein [Bradyrhizobium liaoningense]MBR0820268.1 hypothetical protein [Bradyrhizobium liaoningense]
MLSPPQRQVLARLILDQLSTSPSVQEIGTWVVPSARFEVPNSGFTINLAEWIVTSALAQSTPDQLVVVIRRADNQQPGIESLLALATQLENTPNIWVPVAFSAVISWSPNDDPLTVLDGRPFVDRANFRDLLPRTQQPDTPKCVLVQGEEGHGKSYLHDFCRSFAEGRRDFFVGYTKIGSSGLASLSPRDLAIEIGGGLDTNFNSFPPDHADPHRHAKDLASWVLSFTPKRRVPGLAVFDDVGASGVNDGVRTFIHTLIRSVQDDAAAAEKLRVVLIGYDEKRLQSEKLNYQTYVLEYVDSAAVELWLRKQYPGRPDYLYEETIKQLNVRVPLSGSTRMRSLCNHLHSLRGKFQAPP